MQQNGSTEYKPEAKVLKMAAANGTAAPHANGGNSKMTGILVGEQGNCNRSEEVRFLQECFNLMITEGYVKPLNGDCKVINFKHPKDLKQAMDLEIRDEPETHDQLLALCRDVFANSVKIGHPQFYNQLFAGQDTYGLAGSWMTECINESQYTYEVAPVFTLMEQEVIKKLRELCGYTNGDGIFCPGGSTANMYGINLARYQLNNDYKIKGTFGSKPLVIFASDQSHYSVLKGAAFLGIGTENVIKVKTDSSGRMLPSSLEEEILAAKARDTIPLVVVGTSGTTVLGAYDPLDKIADVCEKYGIWFHIDAAWGGGALLSKKYRHYLNGIERSDSMTWCQHKMMGVQLQCSAFLLNGKDDLMARGMSAKAKYLFQQDKFYDVSYDTGDKSLQCGRKVDAFKLWLMWRAKGNRGFEAEIDHKFAISRYFADLVREREGFELVMEPQCTNVGFWYFPLCLRNEERTPEFWQRLHKVAPQIKEGMVQSGTMLIGYQPNGSFVNFFRIIFANARVTQESVGFVLDEIDRLGRDIQV
ncbi:cysteine sulfinic acid decarboxylase-like [Diadema setosum]|uniref:cysteine sulfinic acid decarboxylase-like n=1 Tax=Diadema setosum TaxID=31175 RepID=UPI003B3B998B